MTNPCSISTGLLLATSFGLLAASTADAQIYIGSWRHGVGKYDTATGALIDRDHVLFPATSEYPPGDPICQILPYLCQPTVSTDPYGLALRGNVLYVADDAGGTVATYVASTGDTINETFITGLDNPRGIEIVGDTMYIAERTRVSAYDVLSGAVINPALVGGLASTIGIDVVDGVLYAAQQSCNCVGSFDATTGAPIHPSLVTGLSVPQGVAVQNGELFVSNWSGGYIGKYDAATGTVIDAQFITGLLGPIPLRFYGGQLYVLDYRSRILGKYDPATGAAVDANFITGITGSCDGLVIAEPCDGPQNPGTAIADPMCPAAYHSFGGPVLTYSGMPLIGTDITLTGSNLSGEAISGLMIGDCMAPAPLSLIGNLIPGAAVCIAPWTTVPSSGGTSSDFVLSIPNDPGWVGLALSAQWQDYEGNPGFIGTSRALRFTMGN